MLELTLRTRSITDLSDDDVQALHYEAAVDKNASIADIRIGLQKAVLGKWKHRHQSAALKLSPEVEGMLQEAQLPQTEQSAGKKERRVALRSKDSKQEKTRQPWHCKVRVLLLGRTSKRKRDDEAAQHPKWFPQYLNSQKEKKQVKRWKAATAASMRVAARQTAEAAAAAAVAATAAVQ
ncbi:hypothetical protein C2E20_1940 [Micractinium conductrix]|uniref:Uncharacterized protein n=1 Tax=Micractinium conductrix TaxID=554055 RepID=A0A2P6VLB4_9CHLO|nr:hypothetical protein C2E20_1940 [Micractinium conductrix]|eukprot:PSC74847.1 hypothetical protein C2E20_1940 [Micractinium conductrix]